MKNNVKKRKTPLFRLAVLLSVLLLVAIIYFSGILVPFVIKINKTIFIKSNYSFISEHWTEKKLALLRERENFNNLKGADQFEYFLKLCNWVHNQWPRSIPNPYPLNNAIDILDDIRAKKTGGFCGQYSFVLGDVLKSLGFFNVRYLELWSNESKNRSHFVLEVWSDKYQKWVILDPDYNIYYQLAETATPANALEIRNSLFSGPSVWARSTIGDITVKKKLQKDLYANFAVSLRSDLMRNTKPLTVRDRFNTFLFYQDKNTNQTFFGDTIPYRNITTRKEDIYFDCNYVKVNYLIIKKKILLTFFTENSMPNFTGFLIRYNNGEWQRITGNTLILSAVKKSLKLQVCPINVLNRAGSINTVLIKI